MGIPDQFIEHGDVDSLLEEIDLTKEEIIKTISIQVMNKTTKDLNQHEKQRKM